MQWHDAIVSILFLRSSQTHHYYKVSFVSYRGNR